jgi:hypothetical protein
MRLRFFGARHRQAGPLVTSRGSHGARQSSARPTSAQASAALEPVEPRAADARPGKQHSKGAHGHGQGANVPLYKQRLPASAKHDPPPPIALERWLRDAHELYSGARPIGTYHAAIAEAVQITRCAAWLEHVAPEHLLNDDACACTIGALAALVKRMPDDNNVAAGPLLVAMDRALERHAMRDAAAAAPALCAAVAALVAAAARRERTYAVSAELTPIAQAQRRYGAFEPRSGSASRAHAYPRASQASS